MKYPFFMSDIKVEIFLQILEKYSNTKFHENLSGENRVLPCGLTHR